MTERLTYLQWRDRSGEPMNTRLNSFTVMLRLVMLFTIIGAIISSLPHPNTASSSSNASQTTFKREVSLEFML
ncbi:MAG: hypothetical protein IGS48_12225 [Oscillatoriales cyanobacterium C42_A2020_001]|nr:hypothetical protein [Leptolyngbyaceae cyanobacterium C42_A2020_001]